MLVKAQIATMNTLNQKDGEKQETDRRKLDYESSREVQQEWQGFREALWYQRDGLSKENC